ncbi:hypothetical protein DFH09DRAFT_172861 [Mycena vulgaris]|nr:hypothetical protein DFH09DRAFT_172861 [Mycena vulgaris]
MDAGSLVKPARTSPQKSTSRRSVGKHSEQQSSLAATSSGSFFGTRLGVSGPQGGTISTRGGTSHSPSKTGGRQGSSIAGTVGPPQSYMDPAKASHVTPGRYGVPLVKNSVNRSGPAFATPVSGKQSPQKRSTAAAAPGGVAWRPALHAGAASRGKASGMPPAGTHGGDKRQENAEVVVQRGSPGKRAGNEVPVVRVPGLIPMAHFGQRAVKRPGGPQRSPPHKKTHYAAGS